MYLRIFILTAMGLAHVYQAIDVTGDDACRFVGLRFLHSPSELVDSTQTCLNVYRRGDGTFSGAAGDGRDLTGAEAKTFVGVYLRGMRTRMPLTRINLLQTADHARTIWEIEKMSLGIDPDSNALYDALSKSSVMFLAEASRDWDLWKNTRLSTANSAGFRAQLSLLLRLISRWLSEPSWSPTHRALIGSCAYYYTDLCSIAGANGCDSYWLSQASLLLQGTMPGFRRYERFEEREQLLSERVSRLQFQDRPDVESLTLMWDGGSDSLSSLALKRWLRNVVCKDPSSWLSSRRAIGRSQPYFLVKLGMGVLRLCGGLLESWRLHAVQALIAGKQRQERMNPEPDDRGSRITDFLIMEGQRISGGLSGSDDLMSKSERARKLLESVLSENDPLVSVREWYRFRLESEGVFPMTFALRALGRAMGLVVRYGSRLSGLRLAPALWPLLHPRTRARLGMPAFEAAAVELGLTRRRGIELATNTAIVSQGIGEGLGPGGYTLISDAEWASLF